MKYLDELDSMRLAAEARSPARRIQQLLQRGDTIGEALKAAQLGVRIPAHRVDGFVGELEKITEELRSAVGVGQRWSAE